MDPLNKPHELPPIDFADIPTPIDHAKDVRRIFMICGGTAAAVILTALSAILVAIARGTPLQTIALVAPVVMAIAITAFGIGYGIPVGLVSLKRLEIAYKMGYFGLGQSREATAAMKTIAERIKKETTPVTPKRRELVEG